MSLLHVALVVFFFHTREYCYETIATRDDFFYLNRITLMGLSCHRVLRVFVIFIWLNLIGISDLCNLVNPLLPPQREFLSHTYFRNLIYPSWETREHRRTHSSITYKKPSEFNDSRNEIYKIRVLVGSKIRRRKNCHNQNSAEISISVWQIQIWNWNPRKLKIYRAIDQRNERIKEEKHTNLSDLSIDREIPRCVRICFNGNTCKSKRMPAGICTLL